MKNQIETARNILNDPDHSIEYLQIWPTQGQKSIALIEIGNFDHSIVQSVIFQIDSFRNASASVVFWEDIWLNSLCSDPEGNAMALQVGRTVFAGKAESWKTVFTADGLMNRVWALDQNFFVLIGEEGLLYTWTSEAGWKEIEDGYETSLNDIHGRSRDLMYIAAASGSLQKFTPQGVDDLDLPFNHDLLGVYHGHDGLVRACGESGMCLVTDEHNLTELTAPDITFMSVTEFQGKFYWGGSESGVFEQVGSELELSGKTGMGYDLRAGDRFLYCSGSDAFWQFDGKNWQSLKAVFDDNWRLVK